MTVLQHNKNGSFLSNLELACCDKEHIPRLKIMNATDGFLQLHAHSIIYNVHVIVKYVICETIRRLMITNDYSSLYLILCKGAYNGSE